MALRSIARTGLRVGTRVVREGGGVGGLTSRQSTAGAHRKSSSFAGNGHSTGSQASSDREAGSSGAGTHLFKLVETDLISKELTRYGPSDAQHLGLHSVQDVLADIAAATSATSKATNAVANAPTVAKERASVSNSSSGASASWRDIFAAWGLGPSVTDANEEETLEDPSGGEITGKMAIKRTYQPSTIKRKRKHGFLNRTKTRLGRKILERRQDKGRRRLGI